MALRLLMALGGARVGGAEAFFVSLAAAFKRAGFDVHAVLRDSPIHTAGLTEAVVPFETARFGPAWDVFTRMKLRRIARDLRPDVVLAFASRANAHMPSGNYALIGRLGGYYKLRHFARCDHLVCNAPDLVRHVTGQGWPKERVTLIPNFPNVVEGRAIPRVSLDTPEGVPLALALGRFHKNKAMDTLIRAMALVPELWLWLAGEGEERDNLIALARQLGVQERVKFLGWRTDRGALFKSVDFCVYPSREEPFGNVVVEAWGYGVPLVTTATKGPSWLAKNGEDAIIVPVDNPEALAEGMRTLASSKSLGERLAANGLERMASEFSEAAIVRRYVELFERVVAMKKTG
jgi:glycosyltransferase involved in cell wall biosynthesis